MLREMPFVGRTDELAKLVGWSTTEDGPFVVIEAGGGMGKTRLLQEVNRRFQDTRESGPCAVLLDLADTELHIPLAIENAVLRTVSPEAVEKFENLRTRYTHLQQTNATPESLTSVVELATEMFIELVNQRTATAPARILIDTVDLPICESVTFRRFLSTTLPGLVNTSTVLAGRHARAAAASLASAASVAEVGLGALDLPAARAFFADLDLSNDLVESLVFLSAGRPILLGLAAQWVEVDVPLPEIVQTSVAQLRVAAGADLALLRKRFREGLVAGLTELRDPINTRILEMANFEHRYTAEMVAFLHGGSAERALQDFDRVRELFFVKSRPNGTFVLHDEMRDLVNDHVWPLVDPLGEERKALDARIIEWYGKKTADSGAAGADAASSRLDTEQQRWIWLAERAFYSIRHDPVPGGETLIDELRLATHNGHADLAGLLLELTLALWHRLAPLQRIQAEMLRAEWQRMTGRRESARALLAELAQQYQNRDVHRCQILRYLANVLCEEGKANEAWETISEVEALGKTLDIGLESLLIDLTRAVILLARGMLSETVAIMSTTAPALAEAGRHSDAAHAYDRLAFAHSILGQHEEAVANARVAIAHRAQTEDKTAAAVSVATLGSIYRDNSRFDEAITSYDEALAKFRDLGDLYWESAVLMERGLCWLLQYEELRYSDTPAPASQSQPCLDRASADLERSVELCAKCNKQELPKALHELGHVRWEQGRPDLAREWWEKSLEVARAAGNLRYVLENEIGMCELDVEAGEFEKALTHRQRIVPLYERTKDSHHLLWSRLRKLEAEALFGLNQFDDALSHYRDAMPELARHGGWGRYRLDFELRAMRRNIDTLPSAEVQRWLRELGGSWRRALNGRNDIPNQQAAKLVGAISE